MPKTLSNTYSAVHQWIRRVWGKPTVCEHCLIRLGRRLEWATVGDTVTRNRHDWLMLCRSCHKKYDDERHGTVVWNKGNRKVRPEYICLECQKRFRQKRAGQTLCSQLCARRRNGRSPKSK